MTVRTRTRDSSSGLETKSWERQSSFTYDKTGKTGLYNTEGPHQSSKVSVTATESMTDTVTQQFKKLSSEGKIVLSPMTKSVRTITDLPTPFVCGYKTRAQSGASSSWGWYNFTTTGECFSSDILNIAFETPPPISCADVAVSKAHANISLSETQLWASLGEARETLEMIRDSYKLVKGLLTRDLRTIKRLKNPKEIANAWMALRYGIRPLYYEINGYLNALHAEPPNDCRQTFRGYATESISSERLVDKQLSIPPVVLTTKQTTDVTVRARAGVLTDVEYLGASQLLGLWEIPQSAWELVPFSFIIDWFFNVGNVIASWTPKPGFKVLGSWVVIETTTKQTAAFYSARLKNPCSPTVSGCCTDLSHSFAPMYQIESVTTQRVINPSRPILPSFDVRLDYLKILDLAIIIKDLFRKR